MKADIKESPPAPLFFRASVSLEENTKKGIRRAFFDIGDDLITEFNKQVLVKDKKGRIYIRRDKAGRGRRHRSSAAGQTAANRTGTYRKSVGYQLHGTKGLAFGVRAPYGGFLETGTSRMKPRPGLGNAIEANERNIVRSLSNGIIREI